ncbi:hypothetical protein HanXRQr2_Chr07g0305021 [Helianthus annuus]|uniref:Uncharacterized protein n=1 Tax=Helianthus annuus TaxID=4232 RepID=A0A251TL98_HELAN|nr:hypothetical protein HanXRQr2_Chr07g0305021 [Helianthus annuus]
MESSVRDIAHVEPQKGGLGSQLNNGNDRQQQRYRRNNSGPHSVEMVLIIMVMVVSGIRIVNGTSIVGTLMEP